MSTKTKRITPEELKNRLKSLKTIGVLKDVSARGKLTDSQKAAVRKNWKKYQDIVSAEKGTFIKQDVSFFSGKEKKALESSGYKIIGGKAFIDKEGNKSAKIKRVGRYIENPITKKVKYEEFVVVDRTDKTGRKTEREFAVNKTKAMTWRDKLVQQYEAGEFQKGDFIGVKIGESGMWRREIIHTMNELFKYIDQFEPTDPREDKEKLLHQIRLVKLTVKDYRDLALTEKTKKEKNHDRYMRAKKRKDLGVTKSKSKNKLVGKPRRK